MKEKNAGPFQRQPLQSNLNFNISSSWAGVAFFVIAISQVPLALKASLDIACITQVNFLNIQAKETWCQRIKSY